MEIKGTVSSGGRSPGVSPGTPKCDSFVKKELMPKETGKSALDSSDMRPNGVDK